MPPNPIHAGAERAFARWAGLVVTRPWTVIAITALVTAVLVAGLPKLRADFSDDSYLRAGDDALETYDAFRARYGTEERILVGIAAPEIFDLAFLEQLRALHAAIEREVPHIEEVQSLVNARDTRGDGDELVVDELLEQWPETQADIAALRERVLANPLYVSTYVSRDGDFAGVMVKPVTYSSLGDEGDDQAIEGFDDEDAGASEPPAYLTGEETSALVRGLREVTGRFEAPGFEVHLAGGEVFGEYMTEKSMSDVARYTSLSIAAIVVLLALLLRRVSAALLPLFVVTVSAVATFGAMAHLGLPFTIVTQILPTFLIAVGVCDSVHILALFDQRMTAGDDRREAIVFALEHSGLAVVLTSLTTAGGLASFMAAEIAPVAHLGLVAPIGVLLALLYSLALLPALLVVLPAAAPRGRAVASRGGRAALLTRLGDLATRHPVAVLVGAAVVVLAAMPGVMRVRLSNDSLDWLFEDDPFRVAIERIDEAFEGTMRLEILVDTGRENGLHEPAMLRRVEAIGETAKRLGDGPVVVGPVVSIVDVVKEINQALHENRPEHYTLPDDRRLVAQELLLFEQSGSDDLEEVTDTRFQEARVSLRAPMIDGLYYAPFLERLEAEVSELLGPDVVLTVTGGMALASRAFSLLLESLLRSYGLALAVITPMMMLMIGHVRLGLLSMIPNLLPVVLVLGLMGWLGVPLNISTMLVGSIVIGLAVDDTIHFMRGFTRYYAESGDATDAVHRTLATTGSAMLVTTLVLATSFYVFLLGSFTGTVHLGVLAGTATVMAFLADVLVAPALMVLATRRGS